MQLTQNISLEECIKSYKAKKLNIDNSPSIDIIENLSLLADRCLQPIRSHFNKKLLISSGYRCKLLNKAVGGSETSQHCKGEAADFTVEGIEKTEVIDWIKNNLIFDQLIDEYSGNKSWVHLSYSKERNRKEVLRYKKGVYTRIKD